ncbi:MAG: hypothetical protein ACREN5_01735, partial [Gemmatimonadales bacterium]
MVIPLALALALQQAPAREDPARVIWIATRAVEGDSAARVSAHWSTRLRRDSTDRAAELGLATIARLTYQFSLAERRYAHLVPAAPTTADGYLLYARLGQAEMHRANARFQQAGDAFARAAVDAEAVGDSAAWARALVGLARVRARSQGPATVESLWVRAAPLIGNEDLGLRADFHCARASVLALQGAPGTQTEAQEGAELAQRAGDARLRAGCRYWLAAALERRGQQGEARE